MTDARVERAPALQENAAIRIEGLGVNHGRSSL
jgi:hypothetical protein